MLYHLDRGWADHLAYLADIRESIHLRALGRQNPLDEFHRMAVDAFASLAADAIEAAQQTFETANVARGRAGLDLSKLARPTSTWTYMVHDNPLADDSHVGAEPARGIPLGLPHGSREQRPGAVHVDRVLTVPNALSACCACCWCRSSSTCCWSPTPTAGRWPC